MGQWLRIHLPMQGTLIPSLRTKIPHTAGRLSPRALEPVLYRLTVFKKTHQNKQLTHPK